MFGVLWVFIPNYMYWDLEGKRVSGGFFKFIIFTGFRLLGIVGLSGSLSSYMSSLFALSSG